MAMDDRYKAQQQLTTFSSGQSYGGYLHFEPSLYSNIGYGADEALQPTAAEEAAGGGSAADQYIPLVGQLIGGLLSGGDPREEAAVIRAKIENKKALKKQMPALSLILDADIRRLQERLVVVERQAAEAQASVETTQTAKTVALIGGGVAVLAGVAITIGLAGLAVRAWRQ